MLKKTIVSGALLLLLTGCGATEVDIEALEKDIVAGVKDQAQLDVTANCPDQVDWETGESFTCDVEFDDGSTGEVDVEMVDDDGTVNWNLKPAE